MSANHQAQAILLLTAHLGKAARDDPRPLGPAEWGRFAQWLRNKGMVPEALLREDPLAVLEGWIDRTITLDRIRYLLGRAGTLGLALERWERAGLWVMVRSDPDYPHRLKRRLKADSPPFLFGCGDRSLLDRVGIAIVGSRQASDEDLAFASRLGAQAALERLAVVSGGARGVDEAAMLGALEMEGAVVGILADSLLRAATSAKYRKGLMAGNLVLISPFNPEAGFDVGNAMARNKYVYCLADAAIVIATGLGKGGTWNGAVENLKNRWVPLWVKATQDRGTGNAALVDRGARCLQEADLRLSSLLVPTGEAAMVKGERAGGGQRGLFDSAAVPAVESPAESPPVSLVSDAPSAYQVNGSASEPRAAAARIPENLDFYTLFLVRLESLTAETPAEPEELIRALAIHKAQLAEWLMRALAEGRVRKLNKPVRYVWISGPAKQPSLFDPNGH